MGDRVSAAKYIMLIETCKLSDYLKARAATTVVQFVTAIRLVEARLGIVSTVNIGRLWCENFF